jgi:hypothetical protein
VYGFGDKFFSCSGFARYQNGRTSRSDSLDKPENTFHFFRTPDYRVAANRARHRLAQSDALFFITTFFDSSADEIDNLLIFKRLADDSVSAFFPGRNCRVESGISRNHQDYGVFVHFDNFFKRSQSAYSGH